MTISLPLDRPVRIADAYRLQWEAAQQRYVLLYPEGMVGLNAPASAILQLCDGSRTIGGIIDTLKDQYPGADLEHDVLEFLEVACNKGWICAK